MTSIRDLLGDALGVGTTVRVTLERRDGALVADHPNDASPVDIAVVEDETRLEERPPSEPVAVEILDRIVDGRVAGRIVDCESQTQSPDADEWVEPDCADEDREEDVRAPDE